MADREFKSERPAERNLKESSKKEKTVVKPSSPSRKTGPQSSEEHWIRQQQDPAEAALRSESGRPSLQKRILRYQNEHPADYAVSIQESKLKATRQEAAQMPDEDLHELQRRHQMREAMEKQATVSLYTDSHKSIIEESQEHDPSGPYEKKVESGSPRNSAIRIDVPEGLSFAPQSGITPLSKLASKRDRNLEKADYGKSGDSKEPRSSGKKIKQDESVKSSESSEVSKIEPARKRTAKKTEQAAHTVISAAKAKGKSAMESGQDENDALLASEQAEERLEYFVRNRPKIRKKTGKPPAIEDERLKSGSWYERKLHPDKTEAKEAVPEKRRQKQKEYQKRKIQRAYARAFRGEKASNELERSAEKGFRRAGGKLRSALIPANDPLGKLFRIMLIILAVILLLTLLAQGITLFVASGNGVVLTTYPNPDEEIYAAENEYRRLEQALEAQLTTISLRYPGYQEYNMDLDDIGHDPYVLISYLTTYHWNFTYEDVEEEIQSLFNQQYELSVTPSTRQRHGETIATLEVRLINHGLDPVVRERMDEEQLELYDVLMVTKGNRDYLFNESNTGFGSDGYMNYSVPEEALSDEQFARMLREAEKYLGWPYVWGGSSPADGGFDCSGYVCWVVNNCGNGWNVGRTTAEGLRRMCAYVSPAEAKPGDLVFFQGTYNTEGASHVGIYVGNGMMINAGDPIKYADINSAYWAPHFMQFGRLPGANPGTSSASVSGFSEEDRRLLADCIYWEARGQSFECQCYVGQVILNRVYDRRYPNTIRGVIGQAGQYANGIRSSPDPCYEAADAVLSGRVNMPRNVIYQAQFKQGSGVWKYLEGEYFCYG